jgi:DNA-binding cell septation regulator SpoVG
MTISTPMQKVIAGAIDAQFVIDDFQWIRKRSLLGKFDLTLPNGLLIHGMMLMETNGRRWIGMSSREWIGSQGDKQYAAILEFVSCEAVDEFQAAVMEGLDRVPACRQARP